MHYLILNNEPLLKLDKKETYFPYINSNTISRFINLEKVKKTQEKLKKNDVVNYKMMGYLLVAILYNPQWQKEHIFNAIFHKQNGFYDVTTTKLYDDPNLSHYKKIIVNFNEIKDRLSGVIETKETDNLEINCFLDRTVIRINGKSFETHKKPKYIENYEEGKGTI